METQEKKKRTKQVFNSHQEVAHIWASQSQEHGRANNIFFEGKIIYSYGKHFPVAKIYPDNHLCLFTYDDYSVSTNKHKSIIGSAIPKGYRIIYCLNPDGISHHENKDSYVREIKSLYESWKNARERSWYYFKEQQQIIFDLNDYCRFFEIGKPLENYQNYIISKEKAREKDNYYREKREERERVKEEEKQRLKEKILPWIEILEKDWINHDTNMKTVAIGYGFGGRDNKSIFHTFKHPEMMERGTIRYFGFTETKLRVTKDGKKVETSMGAKVPYQAAKRLFEVYWNNRNITGEKVGHFIVHEKMDDSLVIGCHRINKTEIIRFADSQNWI